MLARTGSQSLVFSGLLLLAYFSVLKSGNGGGGLVHGLENGLARKPPMGWLSWERFTCTIDCKQFPNDCVSSQLYQAMADRLVEDGYAEVGYEYVNIDDCWSEMERDPASGNLLANATSFPEGIPALAEYIHGKKLKLGIYGDCGTKTCAGYPAQLKSEANLADNYFELDARRLAEWQVDSLKFDGCYLDPAKAESICPRMAQAIASTQRHMVVICEWPFYMLRESYSSGRGLKPNFTLAQEACNAWRYYEDIEDSWLSVLSVVDFTTRNQKGIVQYHGPGHWFDPDQLVIGNFALSLDQARTQMALWCLWSAPLYMSNDLRQIDPAMAEVLKNKKLIEVDQDELGVLGLMVTSDNSGRYQAFVKPVMPFRDGCPSFVVVYLNRNVLGNKQLIRFKVRELLLGVPFKLAADRYNSLHPQAPVNGDLCEEFFLTAMTKDPRESELINKPVETGQSGQSEPKLEYRQVEFQAHDLFGDVSGSFPVRLNSELELKVNPSGVRAVKLQI